MRERGVEHSNGMEGKVKLYIVELQGMKSCFGVYNEYGISYVVATDPTNAYEMVKTFLDSNDLGFSHDRRLKSVTLLADEKQYNEKNMLFIQKSDQSIDESNWNRAMGGQA